MAMHPTLITKRYHLHGLPDTTPHAERVAWERHLAGFSSPLRLLPKNGAVCTEGTIGGATCGYSILIDGTCPNPTEHGEPEMIEDMEDTDSVEPTYSELEELISTLREQRDQARRERDRLNEALSAWSGTKLDKFEDEDD